MGLTRLCRDSARQSGIKWDRRDSARLSGIWWNKRDSVGLSGICRDKRDSAGLGGICWDKWDSAGLSGICWDKRDRWDSEADVAAARDRDDGGNADCGMETPQRRPSASLAPTCRGYSLLRSMTRYWRGRRAPCTGPWSGVSRSDHERSETLPRVVPLPRAQAVERALQDVGRRHPVDPARPLAAREVGVEHRALGRDRGPALVP